MPAATQIALLPRFSTQHALSGIPCKPWRFCVPKKISGTVLFLGVLFFLLLTLPQSLSFYVDWLWFQDLGLEQVFTTKLHAQFMSALAGGIAAVLIAYINLRAAARATKGRAIVMPLHIHAMPQLDILKHVDKLKVIVPVLLGLFVAVLYAGNWLTFITYLHASDFTYVDPIFNKNASFYVFTLPVLEIVSGSVMLILGVSLISSALLYLLKGAIFIHPHGIGAEKAVRIHLSILGSLLFLVLSLNAYIGMHALISSSNRLVAGAAYTDIHATIPFLKAQMALAIVTAALLLFGVFLKRSILVLGGIGLYIAISFIGSSVYPSIIHKFVVAPNELVKETPYLRNNISATRKAYNIDEVEERDISGSTSISKADIKTNSATIENIRLWDHKPLLDTFSQVQEIRTYYDFTSVDIDRYMIDGKYRQTMLSARELSSDSIPTRNWINETLSFTHGYGLTLGPVNQVTPEGLPVLFVKDIPPVSSARDLSISRPEIYFGELSSSHVIVNTNSKEFDYPSGEKNVFTSYAGSRGVKISSLFRKLLFSAHFGSLKLFLSNDITRDSRILFDRNITERTRKVMPFLLLDRDPYMVISEKGELFWIYDAYTASNLFPYAQRLGRRNSINYIRNSVKITINAYDGSMVFYIADEKDPIVRTYDRVFPGILRPLSEMPSDLRKHVRYPEDIFNIQTAIYSTYHMEDPQLFYNREDQWEVPAMGSDAQTEVMEPYYTIMRLPGEKKEEFILMLPYTPKKKQNLAAWMVARSDGEEYGRLLVYRFPKDRLVYGPKQIVARINQDTEISRQISLWDQRGSQVIQGTLLVIPIEGSLIYVQPLYLRAESGKIPELKRVIVAYENRIAMEETLEQALSRIFGDIGMPSRERPAGSITVQAEQPESNLAPTAKEHFDRAMKAQREGDWALYGEEIKKLGDIIRKMQKGR